MQNWLFQGSKIIASRNKASIVADGECVKCKAEPLDNKKSLELFSWHVFGCPVEDFLEDSWRIVCHCNGLPLLLIPNFQVQKVLATSYDSLDDDNQKNLFLDIACFFNIMDCNYAVRILDGLGIGAIF